ncbi:hypothetical protein BDW02DRAFT_635750 [Decorospora gaudefroyi]|uniref:Uncharacterized protein n=1 Tax=Decorospora gaudefroyi TaxID=184978 RepID=A0A6A5KT85_9PLEO|nr:hypothetical protein BDW02DRAFT_635750 [Decorospora gaudefroyi]
MADPNEVIGATIGTQLVLPDNEDFNNDDTMADGGGGSRADDILNGKETIPDHEYEDEDAEAFTQEDHNGEEEIIAQVLMDDEDAEEVSSQDAPIASVENDPEDQLVYIHRSVEGDPQPEPGRSHYDADAAMSDQYEEDQEFGYTRMSDAQHEQPADSVDNDSSTLFVSERTSPPPNMTHRSGHLANLPTPTRLSMPGRSIFARIRNIQKNKQDKKLAASRQTSTYPINVNVDPDNEAYLEAIMQQRSGSLNVLVVDEDDLADKQACKQFEKQKHHYQQLKKNHGGKLSFRQDVEWIRIKGIEDARKKKRARDIEKAREDGGEEEFDLFPEIYQPANGAEDEDEEADSAFDFDQPGSRKRQRPMPRKFAKQMSMQDAELQSMRVALDADGDLPRKKKKGAAADDESHASGPSSQGRGSKDKATSRPSRAKAAPKKVATSGGGRGASKKKKSQIDHAVRQATSLFNSNVFQQQAGPGATEQPIFRSRVKADALKELIASVPLNERKKAQGEMNTLLAATKDFDGKGAVKSDGNSMWIVKGMRTSLRGYQILGVAFMRRRENAVDEPKGGLMADQMGLGKTLMMLANIVNGQPPKGANRPRTTLLIASPALLTQWKNEIDQHTQGQMKIMRYGAGTRVDSTNAQEIVGAHDIVLTTYNEIMKSYPKNEPPIQCQTAEQKLAWWREMYEKHRGVLHRMMFLRIVLDEAQAIKNHMSRTSIACRALMAQHKWALSGTPILNSLTELYPYFKFLGVPHTGSFKIFKHNYCDSGDAENTERLLVRLSQFMIRRTHADEMFGAPILKLPQADQGTYWCEFNSVERCIYDIVRIRFAKNINMWARKGDLEKSYSNALVMLLRLRQLTSHVLMLQFVMSDLLEREDIERIEEVVKKQPTNSQDGRTIIAIRKQLDKLAADQRKKSAILAAKKAKKAAAKSAAKATAMATGREYRSDNEDEGDDDEDGDENHDDPLYDQIEGTAEEPPPEDQTAQGPTRVSSGGQFGKEYNFKPFLGSLKTGESWERAKKKARCGSCSKQPRKPWIMSCGHLICSDCYEIVLLNAAETDANDTPPCKACGVTPSYMHLCDPDDYDSPDVVAQGTRAQAKKKKEKERKRLDREDIAEDWLAMQSDDVLPSAKTIAVKSQIMNWLKENPHVKVIVYTQFLAMIRILVRVCKKEGWHTEQYHGKMSLYARDRAISSFTDNPNSKIMLASLRCGGLGLNLTMASKVIMIDPWWNSASEQQAFCRVFRIGQVEETFMSRLCVKNTVDERLIEMQERKEEEIASVMENDGRTLKKQVMNIGELMKLFGNLAEDSEGKPFILVDNPDPRGGFRADRDDEGYADEL